MNSADLYKKVTCEDIRADYHPHSMNHLSASEKKSQGAHYTPPELGQFVARQMLEAWRCGNKDQPDQVEILDPAVGGGDLLEAIVREMSSVEKRGLKLIGLDCDGFAVERAKERLKAFSSNLRIEKGDFLEQLSGHEQDLFTALGKGERADLIIANPPYVRTQILGADKAQALAKKFALRGRVDLSFPFVLGIIESLRAGGIAGIITSNRFLSTRAGASLRERIAESAEILHLWDLGDTKLFEAAVLPCVLLLKKGNTTPKSLYTSVYSVSGKEKRPDPKLLFKLLANNSTGVVELAAENARYEIKRGQLKLPNDKGGVWKLTNSANSAWNTTVEQHTWKTLKEITKVRVGVKTTADSVFIRNDWDSACENAVPETLRPLITHHLARRFKGQEPSKQILYTHEYCQGKKQAIDLSRLPNTSAYLSTHRDQLEGRKYVTKAGRSWYEIWVPQDPNAWALPKIVFKDIAEKPTFWLDCEGSVVNGDCYWFLLDSELGDVHWLALGVFNSKFIEDFYDLHFANKLYSGRRRFMTQYVSEFPLPNPETAASKKIINLSKRLFKMPELDDGLSDELNKTVFEAFGLPIKKV